MKLIVLVVVAPLALTACKMNAFGGNSSTTNNSSIAAPEVVPDSVTVNGVVYTRAGAGTPSVAPTPVATPAAAPTGTTPPAAGRDDSAGVPSGADSGQPPSTPPSGGHGG